MEHNILYRYYDENDQLLYVGITKNQFQRFQAHAINTKWIQLVHKATFQHFTSRNDVKQAELKAITTEYPLFNIQGVPDDHLGVDKTLLGWLDHIVEMSKHWDDEFDDMHGEFIEAMETAGIFQHFMPTLEMNYQQEIAFRVFDAIENELYEQEFPNLEHCEDCITMIESPGYAYNLAIVKNKIREIKDAAN